MIYLQRGRHIKLLNNKEKEETIKNASKKRFHHKNIFNKPVYGSKLVELNENNSTS